MKIECAVMMAMSLPAHAVRSSSMPISADATLLTVGGCDIRIGRTLMVAPLAEPPNESPAAFFRRLGWTATSRAESVLRPNTSFTAKGADAIRVSSFVLGRIWIGSCDYALTRSHSELELTDARSSPPAESTGLPESGEGHLAEPLAATILSAREAGAQEPVVFRIRQTRHGSTILLCRGTDCQPFLATQHTLISIRYLPSPDSLFGTIGIVEQVSPDFRRLINIDVDGAKLRE